MKSAPFEYHAPATIDEAVGLLTELGDGAKVLAGGQSLIPMLALRLTSFDDLVDITRIDELRGIELRDGSVWVGAGTTETAVGSSDVIASAVPLLSRVTPYVGHVQIRNRGTLGGAIAHADPAAEYPAVALALDATMDVVGPTGRRSVDAREFFEGLWTTSLEPDELLVGVSFPAWSGRCGFAVEELARRHGDFAIAGAVVGVQLDADDTVQRCAIGLIGLGSTPERARNAEAEVVGRKVDEIDAHAAGRAAMSELTSVPTDLQGSAAYRTRVGAVLVERAWTRAVEEARRG
jgi:aerobic carbon-monoxide dehydrogenase medium subunit